MSRAQLEHLLVRLRDELDVLERDGNPPHPRLRELIEDVRRQLDQPDDGGRLVADLKRRIDAFEVEHPRLTNILNDLMVTLSNLGI